MKNNGAAADDKHHSETPGILLELDEREYIQGLLSKSFHKSQLQSILEIFYPGKIQLTETIVVSLDVFVADKLQKAIERKSRACGGPICCTNDWQRCIPLSGPAWLLGLCRKCFRTKMREKKFSSEELALVYVVYGYLAAREQTKGLIEKKAARRKRRKGSKPKGSTTTQTNSSSYISVQTFSDQSKKQHKKRKRKQNREHTQREVHRH